MKPTEPGVAAYIARWRPSSVPPQAAAFARGVIGQVAPEGKERAKNLLRAAGKLAGFGIGLGLDAVPEVLLHPSVAERFTRGAPGLSGVARRTLRTNLRFTGRRVVPRLYPADLPLPRERAKEPYSLRFNLCGAGGDLQAAFLMTGCLAAGVLVRPLGRPGPAREGFGGLAGVPASAIRRSKSRRTRPGVSRPGLWRRSQGRRWSSARARARRNWVIAAMMIQVQRATCPGWRSAALSQPRACLANR